MPQDENNTDGLVEQGGQSTLISTLANKVAYLVNKYEAVFDTEWQLMKGELVDTGPQGEKG